jgi:hypothetical protein
LHIQQEPNGGHPAGHHQSDAYHDTRGDKDKKMEASCGAVTLVPASSDSVDETGVEPEKQEVKVSKG